MSQFIALQKDPWQPYDAQAAKKKPVVPEPSAYGAILFFALLVFFVLRKNRKKS